MILDFGGMLFSWPKWGNLAFFFFFFFLRKKSVIFNLIKIITLSFSGYENSYIVQSETGHFWLKKCNTKIWQNLFIRLFSNFMWWFYAFERRWNWFCFIFRTTLILFGRFLSTQLTSFMFLVSLLCFS